MKIKSGFMLREVAGQWVVVPLGERVVQVSGILSITSSGAVLWKALEAGVEGIEDLARVLLKEYDQVDEETALADVRAFVAQLSDKGLLE